MRRVFILSTSKKIPQDSLTHRPITNFPLNPTRRGMASLRHLKTVENETGIKLKIENDPNKNPFGTFAPDKTLKKNHIFFEDAVTKENVTCTHSKQNYGSHIEKELPDVASIDNIFRKKKEEELFTRVNYFYRKPNYSSFFRDPLPGERRFIRISHVRTASRMLQLKREKPEFFKVAQSRVKNFLEENKNLAAKTRHGAYLKLLSQILQDGKNHDK